MKEMGKRASREKGENALRPKKGKIDRSGSHPIYETEEDRANEEKVAKLLEETFKCKIIKSCPLAKIDRTVHSNEDGSLIAFVEIKSREWKNYHSLMIDLSKVEAGIELGRAHRVPFWIILYKKNLKMVYRCRVFAPQEKPELDRVFYEIAKGGRTDRGPYDQDICAYIPMKYFKFVGTIKEGGDANVGH